MLNGTRVFISVKVHADDRIELHMEQERSDDIMPQPMELSILYEDEALLVLNKPAGIVVHPTHGHYTGTLANGVVHYWNEQGWNYRFRAVHRLDQDTSGVLVVAKNPYIHQHISEQMIAGSVDKKYIAFVHGQLDCAEGDITGPIDRDPLEPHRRIVTPAGYPSLTRYKVCRTFPHASLVELKLETGRTHQIRVHMLSIGYPLIGDPMYHHPEHEQSEADRNLNERIGRQALHAASLSLYHPMLGKRMTFTAPLPQDLLTLQAILEDQGLS